MKTGGGGGGGRRGRGHLSLEDQQIHIFSIPYLKRIFLTAKMMAYFNETWYA